MERNRYEELTDKCSIHYFELSKVSKTIDKEDLTQLWLQLIDAETEEEFEMLTETGVEPIKKAVYVVHQMSEDETLQEIARMREEAQINEKLIVGGARKEGRDEGREEARKELEPIIAEKDSVIAEKDAEIATLKAQLQKVQGTS